MHLAIVVGVVQFLAVELRIGLLIRGIIIFTTETVMLLLYTVFLFITENAFARFFFLLVPLNGF